MNYIEKIAQVYIKDQSEKIKVVFPEGDDLRIIDTVKLIFKNNIPVIPVLIGNGKFICEHLKEDGIYEVIETDTLGNCKSDLTLELTELLIKKRGAKITPSLAKEIVVKPNYFATLMLEANLVRGLVGGIKYATAEILRPVFEIIKTKPDVKIISSSFLLEKNNEVLMFSDCAINIDPSAEQLSEIAIQTVETASFLKFDNKNVALLSFSTNGSANHSKVDLVSKATTLASSKIKNANVDGEMQFDAAVNARIGKIKAPNSKVAGKANILIFPDLASANIGCKIMQEFGGFKLTGPILQGVNKPVMDLSRGAATNDIYQAVLIILMQNSNKGVS